MGSGYSVAVEPDHTETETETKVHVANPLLGDKRLCDAAKDRQAIREAIGSIPYTEYDYPFENLVFEGGGAKGAVYIGCLQVCMLTNCQHLPHSLIRRKF